MPFELSITAAASDVHDSLFDIEKLSYCLQHFDCYSQNMMQMKGGIDNSSEKIKGVFHNSNFYS